MHAYLIITKNINDFYEKARQLASENHAETLEFPLQKIDDARSLNSFLKLSVSEKLFLITRDFQNATEECANAMLKSLEEPQSNVSFAIHSTNENTLLPTIKSRCKIIRLNTKHKKVDVNNLDQFMKKDINEKSNFLEGFKSREDAISFANLMLYYLENKLFTNKNTLKFARYAVLTLKLKNSLEKNGNLKLHVLNYLTHISN